MELSGMVGQAGWLALVRRGWEAQLKVGWGVWAMGLSAYAIFKAINTYEKIIVHVRIKALGIFIQKKFANPDVLTTCVQRAHTYARQRADVNMMHRYPCKG